MRRVTPILLTVLLLVTGCSAATPESASTPTRSERATVTETPRATPSPTSTPTETPDAVPPITDAQRHWLEVQVDAGGLTEQNYRDTICPMDQTGREYYADLVSRQSDMTTAQILAWFQEWCGS